MAQFNFYGSRVDWFDLCKAVLSFDDAYLLPYQIYPSTDPIYVRDAEAAVSGYALGKAVRLFYVGASVFSKSAPRMKLWGTGKVSNKYMIVSDAGGPFCHLSLPPAFEVRNILHLNPGDWFHPSEYWRYGVDGKAAEPIKPSEAVKEGYEGIKKRITTTLMRIKVDGRTVRVGEDAYRSLMDCRARIKVNGKWYRLSKNEGMIQVCDDISELANMPKARRAAGKF